MDAIRASITRIPGAGRARPAFRVDLSCQITDRRPYEVESLRWLDDPLRRVDYGAMLAQQIRRLNGVTDVSMTAHGSLVEVGWQFDNGTMSMGIQERVELTLRSRMPWGVVRSRNGNTWRIMLPVELVYPDGSEVGLDESSRRRFVDKWTEAFMEQLWNVPGIELGTKYHDRFFLKTDDGVMPAQWARWDQIVDTAMRELVGERQVDITWATCPPLIHGSGKL